MKISYQNSISNFPLSSQTRKEKANNQSMPINREQSFGGLDQSVERFANNLVSSPRAQKFLTGNFLNKFLKMSSENPGLYEAFIALLVTCTARPLTILATPGAKMEDKQYASAHSIASGVSGLAFAYAAFTPITRAIDKILINVNGKNLQSAFEIFYNDSKNADLISKLVKLEIIPDKEAFQEAISKKKNIFKFLKDYLKDNGKANIDGILSGSNGKKRQSWIDLANAFSKKINGIYSKIKKQGVPENRQYLVHKSIEFVKEGGYKLKASDGAEKVKFLLNYTSKIILFPLTAGVTIWAIPKIMKLVFPNHKRTRGKNRNKEIASSATQKQNSVDKQTLKPVSQKPTILSPNALNTNKTNNTVSFAGKTSTLRTIAKIPGQIYEKGYQEPLSTGLSKVFGWITGKKFFSNRIKNLLTTAEAEKYGMKVLSRDKAGKLLKKWDNDIFVSNLPQIAALFGSSLYIFNTIRNKEIDPERKPTLCANMAIVAMFSLFATKLIDRITVPVFDALRKTHSRLMNNRLNYDSESAWKSARQLFSVTFAFRYLGPVLATPLADKVVKLFNNCNTKKD